nr:zinc finger protein 418-like isoform X2 [Dermacentor andersoni]
MAGKETARPYLTMSGGSCNIAEGTSSAATDLDKSGVPEETREAAWHQRENQAAERIQECRVCRFAFTDAEAFEKHTADHMLGKTHNCSEFGKLYMTSGNLTRHLRTHAERSFECSVCGQKFYSKDSCKNHMVACRVGAQD